MCLIMGQTLSRQHWRYQPQASIRSGSRASSRRRAARPSRVPRPRCGGRTTATRCTPCAPRARPSTTQGASLTWPNARMAVSPGVRIGVPASTPNTPTLVIVIVPPARSAGVALPARPVSASTCRPRASSGSDSASACLTFGTMQAALGRHRDAQVHVVLDHDLLGGVVPGRVDERMPGHRDEQRPGHEQQRRDPQLGELGQLPHPAHRGHRLGDVDLEELGHVRRGERARHHGRGHVLAHAADRDALLAAGGRSGSVAVRDPFPGFGRTDRVPAPAARCTSSRVIEPSGPLPASAARLMPRSLASLRTGGFASAAVPAGGGRRLGGHLRRSTGPPGCGGDLGRLRAPGRRVAAGLLRARRWSTTVLTP